MSDAEPTSEGATDGRHPPECDDRPSGGGTQQGLSPATRRILGAVGAVSGLVGLAGCAALGGSDDEPASGQSDGDSPTPARPNGSDEGAGAETAGTGTAVPESTASAGTPDGGATTATPEPTATPCPDTGPLEAERRDLERQISSLESDLRTAETEVTRLVGVRSGLPGAWDTTTEAAAEELAMEIRESVVVLESDFGGGTGWFVDENHLLTNAHVVAGVDELTAYTVDGDEFTAEVLESVSDYHRNPDVALLSASRSGSPLPLGSSEDLEPRTPVVMVGHPLGIGYWITSLGYFLWTEEAFGEAADHENIYTSVPGRQGVSGSPLVNMDGEVVGLTWGATDRGGSKPVDQAPEPADPIVRDWPLGPRVWGQHNRIETVREYYERWSQ